MRLSGSIPQSRGSGRLQLENSTTPDLGIIHYHLPNAFERQPSRLYRLPKIDVVLFRSLLFVNRRVFAFSYYEVLPSHCCHQDLDRRFSISALFCLLLLRLAAFGRRDVSRTGTHGNSKHIQNLYEPIENRRLELLPELLPEGC